MIRIVVGCFFCFTAFLALVVRTSGPGAARHGDETLALFVFELAIGVALIVFGNRSLALRKRVVGAAGRQLEESGSIDAAQLARETGAPDARVRTILLRSGLSNQVGKS
jgi:hypothetical protein